MYERTFELKELQKTQTNILREVDRVCKKYNIPYVLVGGTLLGAKRHKGFIPWDDDLDIAMLREDYKKFEQIAKQELTGNLYLRNFHTDPDYYLPFGKVCKKGTCYITTMDSELTVNNEIFIDVFPLDQVPKQKSFLQKLQALIVKALKAVIIRKKKLKVKKTSIAVSVLQVLCAPFSTQQLMKLQEKVMCMKVNRNTEYIVNNGSNYSYIKQTMPYGIYFPTAKMQFEDGVFPVPRDTEYWLKRIYGPCYMELPSKEKRVTHNIIQLKF